MAYYQTLFKLFFMNTKKHFLIVLLAFVASFAFAQNNNFTQNIELRLGYSPVKSITIMDPTHNIELGSHNNSKFSVELGYKVLPIISLSAYYAHAGIRVNNITFTENGHNNLPTGKKANFYGVNVRLHVLPLFMHDKKSRFDVYAIGTFGLVRANAMEMLNDEYNIVYEQPFWEKGIGLGMGYNITKNIAVFGEYQLGEFYNNNNKKWNAGLKITF